MTGYKGFKSTFETLTRKHRKGSTAGGSSNPSRAKRRAAEAQAARTTKKNPMTKTRKRQHGVDSSRSSPAYEQVLSFNSPPSIYCDLKNTMMGLERLVFERNLEHIQGRKTLVANDIKLHGHMLVQLGQSFAANIQRKERASAHLQVERDKAMERAATTKAELNAQQTIAWNKEAKIATAWETLHKALEEKKITEVKVHVTSRFWG